LRKVDVAGVARSYWLALPPKAKRPAPTVIVLHGGSTRDGRSSMALGLPVLAARDGMVTVYPEGLIVGWNDGRRAAAFRRMRGDPDDVAFIGRMIDALVAEGIADPRHVAVIGGSNGGMMALRLACELSDRLAAVATFNAQFSEEQVAGCRPRKKLPLLFMNGSSDDRIPYAGGMTRLPDGTELGRVLSTDETLRWWRARNRCRLPARQSALAGLDPGDGTALILQSWQCPAGVELLLYTVEGGRHRIPGARRIPSQAEATQAQAAPLRGIDLIWSFVKRH
jgi:polyhydroxybutyrate depolymerase